MEKLKPCPFCGCQAVLEDCGNTSPLGEGRYFVRCARRCVEQSGLWKMKQTAIKRWNRRVKSEAD